MAFSVNTNTGAMAALQSLNATNKGLDQVQSRINTGLKVASTKDDSASYTIAQTLRGDQGGLQAVSSSLSRAKSVTDVAVAGAESISDIVNQMKQKAKQASDDGIDSESRTAINKDFEALRDQIKTIVDSSSFNGTNLLKASGGTVTALQSLTDTDSNSGTYTPDSLSVSNLELDLGKSGGTFEKLTTTSKIDTAASAKTMVNDLDSIAKNLNGKLSTLGAASRKIDAQSAFTSKLSDVVESGIGNLVDADLAKESARLQALQVKQQLGVQALSIANQAPQSITSLFR
ncbi:flagellin [Sphingosinicella sp. BN140058]|uniref:flagellin n=1 Tax=Sphingosinicella sp. BN140058 TaxID=1892855 RepID=UPI0010105B2B|nr:flagellin [Sphingosinicella sp. BN140058]QAY77299.1 flagellin [Sphingosinicella sp. BN140058]